MVTRCEYHPNGRGPCGELAEWVLVFPEHDCHECGEDPRRTAIAVCEPCRRVKVAAAAEGRQRSSDFAFKIAPEPNPLNQSPYSDLAPRDLEGAV